VVCGIHALREEAEHYGENGIATALEYAKSWGGGLCENFVRALYFTTNLEKLISLFDSGNKGNTRDTESPIGLVFSDAIVVFTTFQIVCTVFLCIDASMLIVLFSLPLLNLKNHLCSMETIFSLSQNQARRPIQAVIVDDHIQDRSVIRIFLTRYFQGRIEVVAEADDVDNGVSAVREHRPQLLLLDIELMTGTGFDILELLGDEREKLTVILITSFPQYLLQALHYGALDCLNKPIMSHEFKQGIERGISNILKRQTAAEQLEEQIRSSIYGQEVQRQIQEVTPIISPLPSLASHPKTIHIRNMGNSDIVRELTIGTITYCQASGSYTLIYQHNGKSLMDSKPLKRYEEKLIPHGFIRISRALLLNPAYCKLVREGHNDFSAILPDGSLYGVDAAYRESVAQYLHTLSS
jgi:two-component system, LytTR family, response regulator